MATMFTGGYSTNKNKNLFVADKKYFIFAPAFQTKGFKRHQLRSYKKNTKINSSLAQLVRAPDC